MSVPEGALWVRLPRFIGDAVMITQAVAPGHRYNLMEFCG